MHLAQCRSLNMVVGLHVYSAPFRLIPFCFRFANCNRHSLHSAVSIYAGHNKWSKIKRPKMAADLERSKLISKISSEVISAVKQGGDNPETNLRLASALSRAKRACIPKVTVSNAIQAGKGKAGEAGREQLTMVGRGVGNYSVVIDAVTNNKRRTRPEIKSILNKHGADLMPGSTSFEFTQKGTILVSDKDISCEAKAMELAITIEADDVLHTFSEDVNEWCYKFICDIKDIRNVLSKAEGEDLDVLQTALEYMPISTVALSSEHLETAEKLISLLKSHEDVIQVSNNIAANEITDECK